MGIVVVTNKYTGATISYDDGRTPENALVDAAMIEDGVSQWTMLEDRRNYYRALIIRQDDYIRLGQWVYKKGK